VPRQKSGAALRPIILRTAHLPKTTFSPYPVDSQTGKKSWHLFLAQLHKSSSVRIVAQLEGDLGYFAGRKAEEQTVAQIAAHERAREIHLEMAQDTICS
jgi:hypothetical protein